MSGIKSGIAGIDDMSTIYCDWLVMYKYTYKNFIINCFYYITYKIF